MKGDIVSVVEAAYRVEQPDERAWFEAILDAAYPLLPRGIGVFGGTYRVNAERRYEPGFLLSRDIPDALMEHLVAMPSALPRNAIERMFFGEPVTTFSARFGAGAKALPFSKGFANEWGIADSMGIIARDPEGVDALLCVLLPRLTRMDAHTVHRWSRIAAHLAAGLRLRRRLRESNVHLVDGADAVLAPGGRVAHAQADATAPAALDALRAHAVAMDAARGSLRSRDVDAAIETWRGLVRGQWSLIEYFDHDGRRYLVARRNPLRTGGRPGLTAQQRQAVAHAALGHANKLIAYELGLSEATVSRLIARASAKLGARSRLELIMMMSRADAP